NKALLTTVMESTQLILDSGVEVLNHTGNKTKPTDQDIFNTWLNDIFNSEPYYPQNGFLDDLLSSGKLGIFKNQDLRNLLSSWKPKVAVLDEKFGALVENENVLNNYVLEHGSWLNADQVDQKKRNIKFPVSGFKVDNRILLEALVFENLIENVVILADSYYSYQKETLQFVNEIIALLETELAHSP
ncbi:MAG: hypothetical protein R3359_12430, partial [Marinirhabdus sp.]|nr:hypothetical protein [Marinirhabdus sp.]